MIPRLIVIYTVFMLFLTALSWFFEPYLNTYTQDEIDFGREYAAELLSLLDQVHEGAPAAATSTQLCDYYLDRQEKFYDLKSAATHMKGDQGEDFVYALVLAEDWCKNAAEAAYRPGNIAARDMAEQRYRQARQELRDILAKEYKRR